MLGNKLTVISVTLCSDGKAFAMKVRKEGDSIGVLACQEFNKEDSLADLKAIFAIKNSDLIVVGDNSDLSTVFTLSLPKMKDVEFRNAIKFSINAQVPMAENKLNWAYQIRHDLCQVILMTKDKWKFIVERCVGLKFDIYFPAMACHEGHLYKNGQIYDVDSTNKINELILREDLPEASFSVNWNDLADKAQQELYWGALSQARYMIEDFVKGDLKTAFQLPNDLRLKHHYWSQYTSLVLVAYMLLMSTYKVADYYGDKSRNLKQIELASDDLERQIPYVDSQRFTELETFQSEMKAARQESTRSLPQILNEISRVLPRNCYIKDLRINEEVINCRLLSTSGQIDIQEVYEAFRASDFFDDDIPITRQRDELNLSLRIITGLNSK
ncbi:hypothetical protein PQO03_17760 [Lentisphaera profundi]|uniref:GspL cytoplasmic actin-ATPase-like domain-containing protein n=1 Tax=Lentisphaera profundi TaxID=1658616 RepID=A0ABY7VY88_9BACT|nr:hypothetical protein [Lentisphaera profundi]WDE97674.1 hypothetical protein PQO03_17760 [Lentisphaera profundi]